MKLSFTNFLGWQLRVLKITFGLVFAFFLVGCASVKMASLDEDLKAKSFQPEQGKASIYVYRNENFGAAIPMAVNVNGRAIGQTAAKTYFKLNLLPGLYNFESTAENTSSSALQADSGKNYFIWQEVKMGLWMARTQLSQVDEATGRMGVQESKLASSLIPDTEILPIGVKSTPDATANQTDVKPTSAIEKLKQLQKLYEGGLITEQEFNKKRAAIIEQL